MSALHSIPKEVYLNLMWVYTNIYGDDVCPRDDCDFPYLDSHHRCSDLIIGHGMGTTYYCTCGSCWNNYCRHYISDRDIIYGTACKSCNAGNCPATPEGVRSD